jgi:hypothetical protein
MFKNYLRHLIGFWLFAMISIIVVNIVVDPFAIFNLWVKPGFNQEKPALTYNVRAFKLRQIAEQRPKHLILGSSRAQIGLPDFKHEDGELYYNAAVPQATISEIHDLLVYSHSKSPLKSIILTVDFFGFNANLPSLSQIKGESSQYEPFSFEDKVAGVIGWSGVKGSVRTLLHNVNAFQQKAKLNANPDLNKILNSAQSRFEVSERHMLTSHIYLPLPSKQFTFTNQDKSTFAIYQSILSKCVKEHIDCKVIILPTHARHMALIEQLKLWNHFEEWKEKLVAVTDLVSPKIKLLDFTAFDGYSIEDVSLQETSNPLYHWIDSSHMSPTLGRIVLNKIVNHSEIAFGHQLSIDNIQQHNKQLRDNKNKYKSTHPEIFSEIQAMIDATAKA